jgi:hypothetical protein
MGARRYDLEAELVDLGFSRHRTVNGAGVAPRGLPFSGECPGPRESTTVRLVRPDDLLGHPSVQDRLHVSTTVVSRALAAGLRTGRLLTFRSPGGESTSRDHSPWSARNSVHAVTDALARSITSGPCSVRNWVHSTTAASAMSRTSYSLFPDCT